MKTRTKPSKGIEIVLHEDRFYFPGDTIKGHVVVHPKHPTKTNHIVVRFTGQVALKLKDKETITLFQTTKFLPVAQDGNQPKASMLAAKPHTFEFEFRVPQDLDLPSTMEIAKKGRVRYTLVAIHDRPMVPESLCAKTEYIVSVLEHVDITSPVLARPQEIQERYTQLHSAGKLYIKMSMPRMGFTRGDLVTTTITVVSSDSVVQKRPIEAQLVRIVDIKTTARVIYTQEDVLRSSTFSFDHHTAPIFSHGILWKAPIPMSTPPTIQYNKGVSLHIHYRVRLRIHSSHLDSSAAPLEMMLPITIGTWPRASIPIDDTGDTDDEQVDTDDVGSCRDSSPIDTGIVCYAEDGVESKVCHVRVPNKSGERPSLVLALGHPTRTTATTEGVDRSNSNASKSSRASRGSLSSGRSSQSWEKPPGLSRTQSQSTIITMQTGATMPETPIRAGSPWNTFEHFFVQSDCHPFSHVHPAGTSPPRHFGRSGQPMGLEAIDDIRRVSLEQRSSSTGSMLSSPASAGPKSLSHSQSLMHLSLGSPSVLYHHIASPTDPTVPTHVLQPVSKDEVFVPHAARHSTHTPDDLSDDQDSLDGMDLLDIVQKMKQR